jgi:GAF domain-containing protein/HAMP domain-containing protein
MNTELPKSTQKNSKPSQETRAWGWRTFSLRTKLVVAFLAVTIIPIVIISYFTYTTSRQALTNDANQKLAAAAYTTAGDIDTFITNNLEIIRTAAQYPAVVDYLSLSASQRSNSPEEGRVLTLLTAMSRQDPVFLSSVAVYDVNGITLADTYASDIGLDKSGRNYFKETMKLGLPFASDVEHSTTTGVPSIYFAAPVRDSSGAVIGIVRLRFFASILQKLVIGETGLAGESSYAVLLDTNHIRLAHGSDRNRVFKSIVPLDAAILKDLQDKGLMPAGTPEELSTNLPDFEAGLNNLAQNPYFASDTNGDGGLEESAVATLSNKPWSVAFVQSQSVFLQPVTTQTRNNLLVAIAVTLVVAMAGFAFSQTLAGPIVRLTQTAQAISKGDINTVAKVESGDEIGTLAGTFNTMTAQLREFIGTLEQRVADRTKALTTSTEVSRRLSTIMEETKLVHEVVDQVKNAFNYYHAQIYFFDADKDQLVMAGGTGEAGVTMIEQHHQIPVGRGLVGHAAQNNEPILVSNTSLDVNWLPNPLLPDTKAEAAIPIAIGDDVLGVLDVQHNVSDGLQREDVELLQSIANQVAVAMRNIRQYETTQKIASDMSVVADVGIATSTITNADVLLQEVVDLTKKSFNLYHAHIYLMNEAGDTLKLAAGAGDIGRQMASEGRSIALDSEKSLVARAARTQVGVVVNDVTLDPEFLPNPLLPDTHSEMAVPMIVAGKTLGVLDVQSETVGRFTQIDISIKTTLASQIAIAVQNARSFVQAQKQADRETTLNQISQKIQSTQTIEAALQTAARELGHALGMKPTLVALDPSALSDEARGN